MGFGASMEEDRQEQRRNEDKSSDLREGDNNRSPESKQQQQWLSWKSYRGNDRPEKCFGASTEKSVGFVGFQDVRDPVRKWDQN